MQSPVYQGMDVVVAVAVRVLASSVNHWDDVLFICMLTTSELITLDKAQKHLVGILNLLRVR